MLEKEIADLRRKVPGDDLLAEIVSAENVLNASVDKAGLEFQQLAPDAPSIGRLLQSRVEEMTMRAYMRGLKFRLEEK